MTIHRDFVFQVFGIVFGMALAGSAHAGIIFLAPPQSDAQPVPQGAWVANMPGISYGNTSAGYALQRSQAWRMQNLSSAPSAQNYWLVLPGAMSGNVVYGYSGSNGRLAEPVSERSANVRSHVSRANAYRMKLFER